MKGKPGHAHVLWFLPVEMSESGVWGLSFLVCYLAWVIRAEGWWRAEGWVEVRQKGASFQNTIL